MSVISGEQNLSITTNKSLRSPVQIRFKVFLLSKQAVANTYACIALLSLTTRARNQWERVLSYYSLVVLKFCPGPNGRCSQKGYL